MKINALQLKEIRQELDKLKPTKIALDGNRALTIREAIFALAPTLERVKKRGFETAEIIQRLHEKGIDIKAATLARYLNEYKRGKDKKSDKNADEQVNVNTTKTSLQAHPIPQPERTAHWGGFEVRPDIPDDEL